MKMNNSYAGISIKRSTVIVSFTLVFLIMKTLPCKHATNLCVLRAQFTAERHTKSPDIRLVRTTYNQPATHFRIVLTGVCYC